MGYKKIITNRRNLAILLFVTALLVRIIYASFILSSRGLERGYDAGDYIEFAEQMHEQGWMVPDISEIMLHGGPGYPLILYFDILFTGGDSFDLSITFNILVSSLLCLGIFFLCLKLGANLTVSAMAGFWSSFYVHFLRYVPELNKESVVLFLLIVVIGLISQQAKGLKLKQLIAAALAYAYLIHIDERYFFFSPFLVAFLYFPFKDKGINKTLVFSGIVALLMLPWLYRNYQVFERPVILTERTAPFTDKILGYTAPANPYRKDKISPYDRDNLLLYEAFTDSLINGFELKSKGYRYFDIMREGILAGDTPQTQSKIFAKVMEFKELYKPVSFQGSYTANGYRYHRKWKKISNLVYGIQYGLLLILFPFGLVELFKRNRRFLYLSLGFILIHTFIHLFIAYGLQRYRVPIDFLFIIIAAFGAQNLFCNQRPINELG